MALAAGMRRVDDLARAAVSFPTYAEILIATAVRAAEKLNLQPNPIGQQFRREFREKTTDTRDFDRDRQRQPPQRHVTGDDAIRLANQANREIGALKAIESPHKRYRRP
jgi:hypothetical protein